MKKVLLFFVLVAMSVVSVNAQDNLKWGVMAGMNVSKYTITGFDSRIGFHAGVKAELGLSQEASGAYMDFAALLTLKGAKIDGGSIASIKFNPYYLEVPVHVGYKYAVMMTLHYLVMWVLTLLSACLERLKQKLTVILPI